MDSYSPCKRVTVCRVIARLNIGGPAIHTILLSGRLPKDRYRSILIKGSESRSEGDMVALAESEGISWTYIPELKREIGFVSDLTALWRLIKIFWAERPAIVHTHTAKAGTLGRIAAIIVNIGRAAQRLLGRTSLPSIKLLHTYHGHVFHGYFSPLKSRVFLAIERLLARFTDAIIVISSLQMRDVVGMFRIAEPSKVHVIPLGLDLSYLKDCSSYRGKLRAELALSDSVRLIGVVGRLVPIKRHDVVFKALSVLRKSSEAAGDFCCVVVGDGELRDDLERQAQELGLSHCVRFLGWRRDLDVIYADLDCLVLTSDNEGTPVSVIEALAAEVPVMATAVGGVPDLLHPPSGDDVGRPRGLDFEGKLELWRGGEGLHDVTGPQLASLGILLPPADPGALVRGLELLWSRQELLAECARRGSDWVHKEFSIDRLVRDMDSLYQKLLGENTSAEIGKKEMEGTE